MECQIKRVNERKIFPPYQVPWTGFKMMASPDSLTLMSVNAVGDLFAADVIRKTPSLPLVERASKFLADFETDHIFDSQVSKFCTNFFSSPLTKSRNKPVFVPVKPFQPSLTFAMLSILDGNSCKVK